MAETPKLARASQGFLSAQGQGRTVIEKFEEHSDVSFAIVLLTPDDVGGLPGEVMNARARQNVILELGYFVGKLGRGVRGVVCGR